MEQIRGYFPAAGTRRHSTEQRGDMNPRHWFWRGGVMKNRRWPGKSELHPRLTDRKRVGITAVVSPSLNRREFLSRAAGTSGAVATGLSTVAAEPGATTGVRSDRDGFSFALDGNQVRIHARGILRPVTVTIIADTHLFRDDVRGASFQSFSGRMSRAYNQTRHFQTGEATHPEKGFTDALAAAREAHSDLLALVGDLVSFPSEAAVEWAMDRIHESGIPHLYTAGNHDWHYEGMEGSLDALREIWIHRRLRPLYAGADPFQSSRDLAGIRVIAIDNSTYEILPSQLKFYRDQVAAGLPTLLLVHIPLYAPGRPLGFGCGHPDWGSRTDRNAALERRVPWREGGHTRTTLDFHREVFATQNLLGIVAGHIHRASLDVVQGIPQFVTDANATGAYLKLDLLPG